MIRLHHLWPVVAFSLLLACDSGDKGDKKDPGKADGAKAGAAEAGGEKAEADAAADAKGAAKEGADEGATEVRELHIDVSHDKSGVLARGAAVLEITGKVDNEDLRELSHHAEKLPNAETVCKHLATLRSFEGELDACITATEHHVVRLGPELYGEIAACLLAAKATAELDVCDAAEAEAEKLLHENPHGEGLDQETCDGLFTHFEELSMAASDDPDFVKEVLEEVRSDVVTTCMEQGTKAEIDCSLSAKTLHDLRECASKML